MSIWNRLFGEKCDVCGGKITGTAHQYDGRKLCAGCNEVAKTRLGTEIPLPPELKAQLEAAAKSVEDTGEKSGSSSS